MSSGLTDGIKLYVALLLLSIFPENTTTLKRRVVALHLMWRFKIVDHDLGERLILRLSGRPQVVDDDVKCNLNRTLWWAVQGG